MNQPSDDRLVFTEDETRDQFPSWTLLTWELVGSGRVGSFVSSVEFLRADGSIPNIDGGQAHQLILRGPIITRLGPLGLNF